jgi:hypothetical protein
VKRGKLAVVLTVLVMNVVFIHQTWAQATAAEQWKPVELTFTSARDYANPYIDVGLSVDFTGPNHVLIHRPAFWDGDKTWRVRFAPPAIGRWTWRSTCSQASDSGLNAREGSLNAIAYTGSNPLLKHGLLGMSAGHRNVIHADGTPFLVVGDTAWSLPWRGTVESVGVYADDRQNRGFDAVLLMSIQPDQRATGPRDRTSVGGFDVGFEDLPSGHINQMNVSYFQYMDKLMSILVDHGIVPVYQPVFQGYGWKGLGALGRDAVPEEYARYCRYLVARYGAAPAIWLVGADRTGLEPSVEAGGIEIHKEDAYHQPVGIHYSPADGSNPSNPKGHGNRSHQDADWLDFQWCQTGHNGVHNVSKVSLMHDNLPTKAVANGEPTYEGIGDPQRAAGWWQGNEAWSNLTSGGTMGVVYGVAALWQWKLFPDEPGWPKWALDNESWREAIKKEGSQYVGHISAAFAGYDFADMTKHPELAGGRPCVGIAGKFYCIYLEQGGDATVSGLQESLTYRWFNPKTGLWTAGGKTSGRELKTIAPDGGPWVLFVGETTGKGN